MRVERLADLLDRRLAGDVLVAFRRRIDEIDQLLGGHAELRRRLGELAAPLVEQLAVFGIASEADEDQQKRLCSIYGQTHRAAVAPLGADQRRSA